MRRIDTAGRPEQSARPQRILALMTCLVGMAISLMDGGRIVAQDIEGHCIPIAEITGKPHFVFSPNSKLLAIRDFWRMTLWDLEKDKVWKVTRGIRCRMRQNLLIGTDTDLLWEGSQNLEEVDRQTVEGMAFSPDGRSLALGCVEGILFFDVATGKENRPAISARQSGKKIFPREGLRFSPEGAILAAWSDSGNTILWNIKTRKVTAEISTWNPHGICYLSFSPESKTIATITYKESHAISMWTTDTGKRLELFQNNDKSYETVAFSPDGKILAAGTRLDAVYLYDAGSGKLTIAFADPATRQGILTLVFSPDGRTLAAMHQKRVISLWEVVTRKRRATLRAPGDNWPPLTFSPNGHWLASYYRDASNHSMIQFWDLVGDKWKSPDTDEIARLWKILAGEDAEAAYRAIRTLTAFPKHALPLLRTRLHPELFSKCEARILDDLLVDLDSSDFSVREKATKKLKTFAVRAEGALRRAFAGRPSPEARRRITDLLADIERQKAIEPIQQLRALEVLEHIGTAEALALLQELAKGVPEARLTQEAKASLARLAKRPTRQAPAGDGK